MPLQIAIAHYHSMLPFHVANACCHYLLPLPKPLPIAIAKCHCPLPFRVTIAYNLSVAILVPSACWLFDFRAGEHGTEAHLVAEGHEKACCASRTGKEEGNNNNRVA